MPSSSGHSRIAGPFLDGAPNVFRDVLPAVSVKHVHAGLQELHEQRERRFLGYWVRSAIVPMGLTVAELDPIAGFLPERLHKPAAEIRDVVENHERMIV